jgi:hypothetical protein
MKTNVEGYNIEVTVTSLEEVQKMVDVMKKMGFVDFSIIPKYPVNRMEEYEQKKKSIKRYNNFILASLSFAKAVDEKSALTADELLEVGLNNLPTLLPITPQNLGIVGRTINMLAKVTLADRYGQVKYTKTDPKKFWITPKGEAVVKKDVVKDEP